AEYRKCLTVRRVRLPPDRFRLQPDLTASAGPLADRVEELCRAEEDLSAGHRRRAERVIVEIVLRDQLESRTRLDHARHAVFVRDVDLAVGKDERSAVGARL